MNKGSIVERLCSDLDRKEPRYKSPTLLKYKNIKMQGKDKTTKNLTCAPILNYKVNLFLLMIAVRIPTFFHIFAYLLLMLILLYCSVRC